MFATLLLSQVVGVERDISVLAQPEVDQFRAECGLRPRFFRRRHNPHVQPRSALCGVSRADRACDLPAAKTLLGSDRHLKRSCAMVHHKRARAMRLLLMNGLTRADAHRREMLIVRDRLTTYR